MKTLLRLVPLTICLFCIPYAAGQQTSNPQLQAVLKKMDETAANFRSAEAKFEADLYEKVINEVDEVQYGTIYYRRVGDAVQMKADVNKPDAKEVLFNEGKVQLYIPKVNQLTVYDAGKNRQEVESYFVLGFGGSGQELMKDYDVTDEGTEAVNGQQTAKLRLIPKSTKVKNNISEITLWIDPEKGVSVQQKFLQPQGDYRLTKYSDIRLNEKINPDVFRIKTNSKTQVISH